MLRFFFIVVVCLAFATMLPLFMPVILAVYFTTATSHGDEVMTTVEGNKEVGQCQCGKCIYRAIHVCWWSVIIALASSAIFFIMQV